MFKKFISLIHPSFSYLMMVLLLSACMPAKQAPDEFSVARQAPLSVPTDLTVRVPQPGAKRPQEKTVQASAQAALFGEEATDSADDTGRLSSIEEAILKQAGADEIDPQARETLGKQTAKKQEDWTDRLMFWSDDEPDESSLQPAAGPQDREGEPLRSATESESSFWDSLKFWEEEEPVQSSLPPQATPAAASQADQPSRPSDQVSLPDESSSSAASPTTADSSTPVDEKTKAPAISDAFAVIEQYSPDEPTESFEKLTPAAGSSMAEPASDAEEVSGEAKADVDDGMEMEFSTGGGLMAP